MSRPQEQLAIDFARARRNDGITRSIDHAEAVAAGWRKRARGYLLEYLATHDMPFLGENVRDFAKVKGMDDPPDGRAWGGVLQSAAKEGLIRKVGYAPARSSNLAPKCLWEGV